MQGFEIVLKAMGLDPVKLVEQAEQTMKPIIDKLNQALHEFEQRQAERFNKIEETIKALDPNFVPESFKEGLFNVEPTFINPQVTNPNMPEGGPVDPTNLDPEKLAAMDNIKSIQGSDYDNVSFIKE